MSFVPPNISEGDEFDPKNASRELIRDDRRMLGHADTGREIEGEQRENLRNVESGDAEETDKFRLFVGTVSLEVSSSTSWNTISRSLLPLSKASPFIRRNTSNFLLSGFTLAD